ncbi:MAG: multiheme c-type cytochrome, partial [Desulfuromonadaceae bacterium]
MRNYLPGSMAALLSAALFFMGCSTENHVDMERIRAQEKIFVGSDTCKMCHLEHYDSWKETMHSRMTQDAQKNQDFIIAPIDEKEIRKDLAMLGDQLKVPADKVYIPKIEDIKIVIGSEWKQRYVVQKGDDYFIAPIEYHSDKHRWLNYYEKDWDKRSWIQLCAGCHATGVDIEKNTYAELGVACEACHGKGSWHAALPKTAVFEKRQTIVNPAKLTTGVAAQICGSCHTRGKAVQHEGAGWAVGYQPG